MVALWPPCRLPALLATAGLWDPRVAYWEPIKWVQTLRHHQRQATAEEKRKNSKRRSATEPAPLLLKMDMDAGHFSASDRYKHLEELAFGWAFLLDRLGMTAAAAAAAAADDDDSGEGQQQLVEGVSSRSRKVDL